MTRIIAAFPCLGKTTLYSLNKDKMFDREFNESRTTMGMSEKGKRAFFQHCADIVNLHVETNKYEYIFTTENPELISRLRKHPRLPKPEITLIFPDVFDENVMADYKKRVIERSGQEWFDRVMPPKIDMLKPYIQTLKENEFDVRLTDVGHPYIEDVFEFEKGILLPKKRGE